MQGFLILNKPTGVTSFSMVALVRRLIGVRRVGHAGTLDPLASGVLPVAVGQATRLIEYLDDERKTYVARVAFGAATDSYDAEGAVTATGDASAVTAHALAAALPAFIGEIAQVPPAYSAIKLAGKPAYRYAREGAPVELAARSVQIESIALMNFDAGVAEFVVRCGKGTYIRSLAHDLGSALGCPAHLAALVRTATGGFTLEQAHTPAALREAADTGVLGELMLAPDRAVERRPALIFGPAHALDVTQGRDVPSTTDNAHIARAYTVDGAFLGVLEAAVDGRWHPAKMLSEG